MLTPSPRHTPKLTLLGHLKFALKYEVISLSLLKALFVKIGSKTLVNIICKEQTGSYTRRIWFLYEWLLEEKLNLPDLTRGNFVELLDSKLQYPGAIRISKRYRIKNNLSGVRDFCPIIRRTPYLDNIIAENLAERAKVSIENIGSDVLQRAAAFLLLQDQKLHLQSKMKISVRCEVSVGQRLYQKRGGWSYHMMNC